MNQLMHSDEELNRLTEGIGQKLKSVEGEMKKHCLREDD